MLVVHCFLLWFVTVHCELAFVGLLSVWSLGLVVHFPPGRVFIFFIRHLIKMLSNPGPFEIKFLMVVAVFHHEKKGRGVYLDSRSI